MPTLISSQHEKNRFIGERGRLISDIIKISDWFNIEWFLAPVNMEIALTLFTMVFLFQFWENLSLVKICHIEVLLKDQLSCVTNGGTTTKYFNF